MLYTAGLRLGKGILVGYLVGKGDFRGLVLKWQETNAVKGQISLQLFRPMEVYWRFIEETLPVVE